MQRERVTEDIYVFISELYAQATASVVLTTAGAVLIDTLLYPEETLQIKRFVEERLNTTVRYVINTHFHADHSTGTCFFPQAEVIAHCLCRDLLDTRGRDSLARTKATSSEMDNVEIVLPTIVFNDRMTIRIGNKVFELWHTPGHSPDGIVCLVKEDQILFAADIIMPLPYFVDGSYDDCLSSLVGLREITVEAIIQGHGEVILRGEVEEKIESDIAYLQRLLKAVDKAIASSSPERALSAIRVESCGKNPILINGLAQQLHHNNVMALAEQRKTAVLQMEKQP